MDDRSEQLDTLRHQASACRRCELFARGTQTVFGEGPVGAPVFLVGEQPGDKEDRQGRPFVGPAGQLLHRCLEKAGIGEEDVYVTNAVKHFNWRAQGKRRIHQRPNVGHIEACQFWLENEIRLVRPRILVCLGATAGRAVFGKPVSIGRDGGTFVATALCEQTILHTHPSAILRLPNATDRMRAEDELIALLTRVKARLERGAPLRSAS